MFRRAVAKSCRGRHGLKPEAAKSPLSRRQETQTAPSCVSWTLGTSQPRVSTRGAPIRGDCSPRFCLTVYPFGGIVAADEHCFAPPNRVNRETDDEDLRALWPHLSAGPDDLPPVRPRPAGDARPGGRGPRRPGRRPHRLPARSARRVGDAGLGRAGAGAAAVRHLPGASPVAAVRPAARGGARRGAASVARAPGGSPSSASPPRWRRSSRRATCRSGSSSALFCCWRGWSAWCAGPGGPSASTSSSP